MILNSDVFAELLTVLLQGVGDVCIGFNFYRFAVVVGRQTLKYFFTVFVNAVWIATFLLWIFGWGKIAHSDHFLAVDHVTVQPDLQHDGILDVVLDRVNMSRVLVCERHLVDTFILWRQFQLAGGRDSVV